MKFRFLLTVKLFYFLKFLDYKIALYTLSCEEKQNEANKLRLIRKIWECKKLMLQVKVLKLY